MFKPIVTTFNGKTANSLLHTKWMCKYHIVIVLKYKREKIKINEVELKTAVITLSLTDLHYMLSYFETERE